MNRRDVTIAMIIGGAALVASLIGGHFRDAGRDAELERLHGVISRDSAVRVAAVAQTDSAIARADSAAKATAAAESAWARARRAAERAPAIVSSTKADTVKIRELVAIVDTLRVAGDSLARAAAADAAVIVDLRANFSRERAAWSTERASLQRAVKVSETRARHWGLGATAGYGVVRDNAGVVHAGPALSLGLTYRW